MSQKMTEADLYAAQQEWEQKNVPLLQKGIGARFVEAVKAVISRYRMVALTPIVQEDIRKDVAAAVADWKEKNRVFGQINTPHYDCQVYFKVEIGMIMFIPSEEVQALLKGTSEVILLSEDAPIKIAERQRLR